MHERGIDVDVIVGSKTKEMLILEKEMELLLEIFMSVQMMVLTDTTEW